MNELKIEGLRELESALTQFKKSTARGVLNRALKKAAEPIKDQARADAPVDTGELRDSIHIEVERSGSAGKAAYAAAMRGGSSKAEAAAAARSANRAAAGEGLTATVQVEATAPHAVFAEFGAHGRPGNMFLTNAMRTRGREALKSLGKELGTEIEKSAKRVARRQAKKGTS